MFSNCKPPSSLSRLVLVIQALTCASLVVNPAVRAANSQEQAATEAPYLNGQSVYEISESDYKDLLVYIEEARETLQQTLKEAPRLYGDRLHSRLLEGVESALSQSGVRSDLLLFRYLLENALQLDEIYLTATTQAPRLRTDAQVMASSVILLSSILKALEYHKDRDLPRVGGTRIRTPEWVAFAIDQITLSLRVADLAPTQEGKRDVIVRTLGWVVRALNSDPNRRSYAKQVVAMGRMQQGLRNDTRSVSDAQALLVEVRSQLVGYSALPEPKDRNHPLMAARKPESFKLPEFQGFPLIKLDKNLGKGIILRNDGSELAVLDLRFGAGGTLLNDHNTGKAVSFIEVLAAATLTYGSAVGNGGLITATGDLSVKGTIPNGRGPIPFESRLSAGAAGNVFFGGWAAIEVNQFPALAEFLLHGGWGPALNVRIGDTGYVMVRFQLGWSMSALGQVLGNQELMNDTANMALGGEFILRLSRFIIKASYMNDSIYNGSGKGYSYRNSADLSIDVPLSLIFPNDGIQINGRFIHHSMPSLPRATVLKTGIFYEVKF